MTFVGLYCPGGHLQDGMFGANEEVARAGFLAQLRSNLSMTCRECKCPITQNGWCVHSQHMDMTFSELEELCTVIEQESHIPNSSTAENVC